MELKSRRGAHAPKWRTKPMPIGSYETTSCRVEPPGDARDGTKSCRSIRVVWSVRANRPKQRRPLTDRVQSTLDHRYKGRPPGQH
ncbi:hypothetical protein BHE74_00006295 [Ensete ventricosum]|nr:hypothetical protein GW17_00012877 [Ensete ventricosum]RWW85053.1 hypothetical protein BHE74_00006295 [Ensete ventricosum]